MKRCLAAVLLLLLVLTACGKAEQTDRFAEDDAPSWQAQYDLGQRYFREGDYRAARVALELAIEIAPKEAAPYLLLAQVHEALGDREAAEQCLYDALGAVTDTAEVTAALKTLREAGQEQPKDEGASLEVPLPEQPQEEAEEEQPEEETQTPPAEQPRLSMTAEEVEPEVLRIREIYGSIVDAMGRGLYEKTPVDDYTTVWKENGTVRCIMVAPVTPGSDYGRSYYFDRGQLIFAFIEGADSYRLYFRDELLFRLRYTDRAGSAVNHDLSDSPDVLWWQDYALTECAGILGQPAADYISAPYYAADGTDSRTGQECLFLRVDPGADYSQVAELWAVSAEVDGKPADLSGDLYEGIPHGAIYEFAVVGDYDFMRVRRVVCTICLELRDGSVVEQTFTLQFENGLPM